MNKNTNIWLDANGIVAEVEGIKFRPKNPMQLRAILYNLPVTMDSVKHAAENYQRPSMPGHIVLVAAGKRVAHCNHWFWNAFLRDWDHRELESTADKWMHPSAKARQLDRAWGIM